MADQNQQAKMGESVGRPVLEGRVVPPGGSPAPPNLMPVRLEEPDWARLIVESEGLSGGDILNAVVNAASRALEREGPGCEVTLADFLISIEAAKRARQEIGVERLATGPTNGS